MKIKLIIASLGLFLMIMGFFLDHATQLPLIRQATASNVVESKIGLENLKKKCLPIGRSLGFSEKDLDSKPFIDQESDGFIQLSELWKKRGLEKAPGEVKKLIDTCSMTPSEYRGTENRVVVMLSDGSLPYTSYEELSELIDDGFTQALWPWQLLIFITGVILEIYGLFMLALTRQKKD